MGAVRGRLRELGADLERLTDSVHRDEVARAEQRLRIEALQEKALEDLGVEPEALVEEYGPHQLVPPSPPAPDEEREVEPDPTPYVRAEQEKRLRGAERALALLGRVNPLALEEFAALEERHQFLAEQLEDLKATRRDLMDIIREVDERVEQVFTAAFHDTAREFEGVFARLFPGGEGRLVLTEPGDMLTTGIEVEARPPGKKVKRLSLLSGGERSLTAVALLVAIFKARPSPFYVHGRGRGGPGRHQPGPADRADGGAARGLPAHRDHPPEADHGGRRRAVRRLHARRRHHHGDRPAAARGRARLTGARRPA